MPPRPGLRRRGAACPSTLLPLASLALLPACPGPVEDEPRWDGLMCHGLAESESVQTAVLHYERRDLSDDAWIRMLLLECWERSYEAGPLSTSPEGARQRLVELLGADELLAGRAGLEVPWSLVAVDDHPLLERTVSTLIVDDPWFGPFPVKIGVPDREPSGAVLVHPGHGETDAESYVEWGEFPAWDALAEELVTIGVGQLDYRSEEAEQLANSALHVTGTTKWGVHLWRAVLAHDLADALGYPPIGAIGHSMGGSLALVQSIVDHRLEVGHGDAWFPNVCLDGPALIDATPGLHADGLFGMGWSPELAATVPVWMETEYGGLDPLGFLDAVRERAANAPPPRPSVYGGGPTFVQVAPELIETPDDLIDPLDGAPGLTRTLRRVARMSVNPPGSRSMAELVNQPMLDRFAEEVDMGCEGDEGLVLSRSGWGARPFRIVRPLAAPTSIVLLVPSWSRLDMADTQALAERLAVDEGALVVVVRDLLPARADGLSGVVITSGVQSMGGSVVGIAASQATKILEWARGAVPDGHTLPTVVLTEGRSEAFVGALAAWMDPSISAVVWEERSVAGLVAANFDDTAALDGLRWFHQGAEPAFAFGRVPAGDPDALWCPADHDWNPGLAEVDLDAFYADLADRLVLTPGLEFSDGARAVAAVAEATEASVSRIVTLGRAPVELPQ